jgi:hypothetical protein
MDPSFQPQALIFDLMGICCDWNTSILMALTGCPPLPLGEHDIPKFAADWRSGFFKEIHRRSRLDCLPRILILLIDEFWISCWMIDMWTRVYGMIVCGIYLLHSSIIRKVVVWKLKEFLLTGSQHGLMQWGDFYV